MHSELDPKGLEAAIKAMWGVGGLEGRAVTLRLSQAQEVAKHVLNAYLEASTQSTGGSEGWREWTAFVRLDLGDDTLIDVRDARGDYYPHQPYSNFKDNTGIVAWRRSATSPPGGSEAASAEQILQFMRERGVTKITWGEIAGVAEPDSIDLHAYRVAHLPYPDAAPFDDAFLGDGESVHVLPGEAPPEGIAARDAVIEEAVDTLRDLEIMFNPPKGTSIRQATIKEAQRLISALRSPVSSNDGNHA